MGSTATGRLRPFGGNGDTPWQAEGSDAGVLRLGAEADAATASGRRVPPFRLGHRPALDGVRGIAVVLVVIYHLGQLLWLDAEKWLFPGGFVGVDLFFALSGFLITSLLIADFDRLGRIQLVSFLWRRILRLTPALVVVLGAVFAGAFMGWTELPAGGLVEKAFWTLGFAHSWPAEGQLITELAQTWSLAVEAQFYLLWSVTVTVVVALGAAAHRVWLRVGNPAPLSPGRTEPLSPPGESDPAAPRSGRSVPGIRHLLLMLLLAAVVAVAIMRAQRLGDGQHPLILYTTTPNRIDGPLVGSIGGLAYASGWLDRVSQRGAAALASVGLLGIGVLAMTADPFGDPLYRGGFTAVAVVGTVAVVAAAMLRQGVVAGVLSSAPLVYLGRASYSLFLWHMPVFLVFQREAPDWSRPLRAGCALTTTFALASLSYLLVERPIQRRRPHRVVARDAGDREVQLTVPLPSGNGQADASMQRARSR